jgi:hypothetical protein
MATLPMRATDVPPNEWHRITAPGGYECSSFAAHDFSRDIHLTIDLFDGLAFHPSYDRRYRRYIRRPTRHAPPLPKDFPGVITSIYRKGDGRRLVVSFPAGGFRDDSAVLEIGSNRLTQTAEGLFNLSIASNAFSAELRFQLRYPQEPTEIPITPHHWAVLAPLCAVEGIIGEADDAVEFVGVGYHDKLYATRPLALTTSRILHGHLLLDDRSVAFIALNDDCHIIESTSTGQTHTSIILHDLHWSRAGLFMSRPDALDLGPVLQISNPRSLSSGLDHAALIYEARSHSQSGAAFVEVLYPHRLAAPIAGRLIHRWIERAI